MADEDLNTDKETLKLAQAIFGELAADPDWDDAALTEKDRIDDDPSQEYCVKWARRILGKVPVDSRSYREPRLDASFEGVRTVMQRLAGIDADQFLQALQPYTIRSFGDVEEWAWDEWLEFRTNAFFWFLKAPRDQAKCIWTVVNEGLDAA